MICHVLFRMLRRLQNAPNKNRHLFFLAEGKEQKPPLVFPCRGKRGTGIFFVVAQENIWLN